MRSERLRVALVVGSMVRGGAEKQLLYWARALLDSGAEVRLYALTRGEPFEADVRNAGFSPVWIGERHGPAKRISALRAEARRFRPHIVQSTHFSPTFTPRRQRSGPARFPSERYAATARSSKARTAGGRRGWLAPRMG